MIENAFQKKAAILLGVNVDDIKIHKRYNGNVEKGDGSCFVRLMLGDIRIAHGILAGMPGCCGMVVSTGAAVHHQHKNKGVGDLMHKYRIYCVYMITEATFWNSVSASYYCVATVPLALAKKLGFTTMICTDIIDNEPQAKIIKKNNWIEVYRFTNKRTGNLLSVNVKEI
jgi:hypothetical protein